MDTNNGMLSTRMIDPLNISRQYLSIMENNNDIEVVSRGIYISPIAFEDSYFCFQKKYKKIYLTQNNLLMLLYIFSVVLFLKIFVNS